MQVLCVACDYVLCICGVVCVCVCAKTLCEVAKGTFDSAVVACCVRPHHGVVCE